MAWTCPRRRGWGLIGQRLLPGRPKDSDTSLGRGVCAPCGARRGERGDRKGLAGLPHPGSWALQTHTQTWRGACRPPWDSCP